MTSDNQSEDKKTQKQLELEFQIREYVQQPNAVPTLADLMFPGVSGYTDVKIGMMCMLVNQWDNTARDRIHILLYGKPGTGKTILMEPLEKNHGALYISMDASAASLRGDGRKDDHGAKIFNECDGEIICIDDIEKMKDMDVLRDVMETGRYTVTKGGEHVEYDGHCRIVAATNDLSKMPIPIRSRFDLIYLYNFPTLKQSMDIVHRMLHQQENAIDYRPLISHYIHLAQTFEPEVNNKEEIEGLFQDYFEKHGYPTEGGEPGGKEGRWIASVFRIAKGKARIQLADIDPSDVAAALQMKHASDKVLRSAK